MRSVESLYHKDSNMFRPLIKGGVYMISGRLSSWREFTPVPSYGSVFVYTEASGLHDTNTECHAGASHAGTSLPRFLCRSEIFIPARKFIPVSCKRGMTVRFISIKVSSFELVADKK